MSSLRRQIASRENGSRSHGPATPEGKARSSQNALQHGMFSQCVIVGLESTETLEDVVEDLVRKFQPADPVELSMIEEMASAHWRMRRWWAVEKEWIDQGMNAQRPGKEITRIANTLGDLADTAKYRLLNRYENRMYRIYQRSLKTLLSVQAKKQELKNEGT